MKTGFLKQNNVSCAAQYSHAPQDTVLPSMYTPRYRHGNSECYPSRVLDYITIASVGRLQGTAKKGKGHFVLSRAQTTVSWISAS